MAGRVVGGAANRGSMAEGEAPVEQHAQPAGRGQAAGWQPSPLARHCARHPPTHPPARLPFGGHCTQPFADPPTHPPTVGP